MSEYTPTTEEVRAQWGIAVDHHRRPERLAEFDRMIAEVERAAAARALEEAADEIFAQHDEITAMQREAFHRGADAVYSALRARAAEIRERESDGES